MSQWQSMVLCKVVTHPTPDLNGLLRIASIGVNTDKDLHLGSETDCSLQKRVNCAQPSSRLPTCARITSHDIGLQVSSSATRA